MHTCSPPETIFRLRPPFPKSARSLHLPSRPFRPLWVARPLRVVSPPTRRDPTLPLISNGPTPCGLMEDTWTSARPSRPPNPPLAALRAHGRSRLGTMRLRVSALINATSMIYPLLRSRLSALWVMGRKWRRRLRTPGLAPRSHLWNHGTLAEATVTGLLPTLPAWARLSARACLLHHPRFRWMSSSTSSPRWRMLARRRLLRRFSLGARRASPCSTGPSSVS